jgi:X-X-X-Leu-X-X-Gly heptad repeat protein
MTINQLMAAANTSLAAYPLTLDGNSHRAEQEQLKNWLDQLNNGAGVLSTTPCTYSFN